MNAQALMKLGLIPLVVALAGCHREVSFKNDVHPILEARCISCHAPGAPGCVASGFSVATYQSVMTGTKYGHVVIPGSSAASTLVRLINHEADPSIAMPKSHTPGAPSEWLTPDQIKVIQAWIDQGARDN